MARIKIIYRKLGREQAYGVSSSDGIIEIDSRLKSKKHLEVLIHEILHILNPKDSEDMIIKKSVTLTKILWQEGYRRIDQSTDHEPLQDGSKWEHTEYISKKNGINLTKLVYAESLLEVLNQFKNMEVVMVKELDLLPEGDIDIISLN